MPGMNTRNKVGYRHILGVVGGSAVVGPPADASVGTHDDECMAVATRSHHAVAVCRVSLRDGQLGVRKDGYRETLVRHLLLQCIERIGRDAHDLIDAKRLDLADI